MIERVAKAIATKALGEVGRDYDPFAIQKCIPYARAAIAAMRDCTPEMLDAGSAAHPAGGYVRETLLNDIIECEWVAMCDAALSETKSTTKGEVA
jgi:hypothetical protein